MLAMVRRLTDPLREMTVMYEEGVPPREFRLSRKGYAAGGESRAEFEQDKRALSLAQEQFGEFCVLTQVPWGGMAYEMPKLGPDAQEPPASAMQREMIDWCRERKIRLHTWSPMKAVYPWDNGDEGPGVRCFCPNHKPWWGLAGDVEYNCPANREYMAWFTQLLVRLFRRDGYGGYMLDEFLPHPRTGLPCSATGHDHLPGDASYGYFVARRELCQTLRREFGQGFFLEARRPNQDAGVWDALYLDGFFTLSEDRKGGGDEIRYRSRVRHYYHFIPSTMDMHYFRPTPADNLDYLFLSALAVSNRHIVYGLGRDEAERKRIRHWYDWARAHEDLMTRPAIFLPDWPGDGKGDSYFRLNAAGTGYAFVFNANDTPVSTELPLDERCGLAAGKEYRIRPEFPAETPGFATRRCSPWTSIQPAAARSSCAARPIGQAIRWRISTTFRSKSSGTRRRGGMRWCWAAQVRD